MDKEKALKLVLDDLMAEYGMERTSFAKRVDEIFKQALAAQPATEESSAVATPVQEPVAGLYALLFVNNWDGEGDHEYLIAELSDQGVWTRYENGNPLFEFAGDKIISAWPLFESVPPAAQRTWVGLTVEEIRKCFQIMYDKQENWPVFANSIEAKLKEKNT